MASHDDDLTVPLAEDDVDLLLAQAQAFATDARVIERQLEALAPLERYSQRQGIELPKPEATDELGSARFALEFEQRRRDWLYSRLVEHEQRDRFQTEARQRRLKGIARFAGLSREAFDRLLLADHKAVTPEQRQQQKRERYTLSRAGALDDLEAR